MDRKTDKKPKRVLAVASGGGHWLQLSRLMPAWDGCEVAYVTTDPGYREKIVAMAKARGQPAPRFFVVEDANHRQKWRVIKCLAQMAFIVLRVWPDVVITTGAAPGGIAVWLGARFRRRTVWIDSIANADKLSMSGQKVKPYADLWLTQWAHLEEPEGPRYRGSVI